MEIFFLFGFWKNFFAFQAQDQVLEEIRAAQDRGDPDARARLVRAVTGYELPDGHGGLLVEPQGQNVEAQGPAVSEVVEVAEPEVPAVPEDPAVGEDEVGVGGVEVGDGGGQPEMEASQVEIGAPEGVVPVSIIRNVCFCCCLMAAVFCVLVRLSNMNAAIKIKRKKKKSKIYLFVFEAVWCGRTLF